MTRDVTIVAGIEDSELTCSDITPEQVIDRHRGRGEAWLVDQWGTAHAVSAGSAIGRDIDECALGVLHSSVSAVHARLERRDDDCWEIRDQGSLNGTRVNGRVVRRAGLRDGDIIRVGDVGFRFTRREAQTGERRTGPGQTRRSSLSALPVTVTLESGDRRLSLVRRAEGGAVKMGPEEVRLAPLEYALLRTLVERRALSRDPGEAFVSSRELAAKLDFRTRLADSDNVRELVRRVRQKLDSLGADNLIVNQRGSGYCLAWSVVSEP